MAFLKSSRITGISARDVAVRGFRQSNNIKLGTRAYTRHEVLLADSYDIVGDVTVSDDLILSKLSDDGDDITITGDTTTRTITGSGSIQGATLAQTPNATVTGMSGTLGSGVTLSNSVSGTLGSGVTLSNSVQDSITRLGTVTTGGVPYQLTTGPRELQTTYGFINSNVNQVVSNSNTNTMTGAPETCQTFAVNTGSATNTVWKISGYCGVNNEMNGINWNCSMRFWVSYDGGGSWVFATPGAQNNVGHYMCYSNDVDEYTYINGAIWITGDGGAANEGVNRITANQENTVFGMALYSAEQDNTRYNMVDSMGIWIQVTQYQL